MLQSRPEEQITLPIKRIRKHTDNIFIANAVIGLAGAGVISAIVLMVLKAYVLLLAVVMIDFVLIGSASIVQRRLLLLTDEGINPRELRSLRKNKRKERQEDPIVLAERKMRRLLYVLIGCTAIVSIAVYDFFVNDAELLDNIIQTYIPTIKEKIFNPNWFRWGE